LSIQGKPVYQLPYSLKSSKIYSMEYIFFDDTFGGIAQLVRAPDKMNNQNENRT
jgi:hypothetical protein